jgi:aspartate aminotransferase
MTPGGCGALRLAAETVFNANQDSTVWFSTPTWGNHFPLIESAGLNTTEYPYYDTATGLVDFDAMIATLEKIPAGDLVLLHACCHNPTGADLSKDQWDQVIDVAERQGFIPWFDIAYQGFGQSIDDDAYSVRIAAKRLPEVIVVASCSKNFGLYRERTGAALFINKNAKQAEAAKTNAISLMRKSYSMSPFHGGGIVGTILSDTGLTKIWKDELMEVCAHVQNLRNEFANKLNNKQSEKDFTFITQNQGMFSFLGIELDDVLKLRNEYGIYILNSTRLNMAGLSSANIDYVTDSIATVLNN